jgi:hypothetical protein
MVSESAHHGAAEPSTGLADEAGSSELDNRQPRKAERRVVSRARSRMAGKIIIGHGSIDCVVQNLSTRGARVRVRGYVVLPPAFGLLLMSEGLLFDAAIIWRSRGNLGLKFAGRYDLRSDRDPSRAITRAVWKAWAAR